jgi:hypothetical protein
MSEELKPCQCGGQAIDRGHGIECLNCGIWLGRGTASDHLGGYVKAWNSRHAPEYKYATFEEWKNNSGHPKHFINDDIEIGFLAARELKEK